ncbi:hypothetical protein D3C71_1335050 [compost metagenome]
MCSEQGVIEASSVAVDEEVLRWDDTDLNVLLLAVRTNLDSKGAITVVGACNDLGVGLSEYLSYLFVSDAIVIVKLWIVLFLSVDLHDAVLHHQRVLEPVVGNLETFVLTHEQVVDVLRLLLSERDILSGTGVELADLTTIEEHLHHRRHDPVNGLLDVTGNDLRLAPDLVTKGLTEVVL